MLLILTRAVPALLPVAVQLLLTVNIAHFHYYWDMHFPFNSSPNMFCAGCDV